MEEKGGYLLILSVNYKIKIVLKNMTRVISLKDKSFSYKTDDSGGNIIIEVIELYYFPLFPPAKISHFL